MNNYKLFNVLSSVSLFAICTLVIVSCSSDPKVNNMAIVEQNLKEGRLVPESAVQDEDVLNLYSHEYNVANNQTLAIDITLDKSQVLNAGGDGLVQIALIARPAVIKKSIIQFLIYDDSFVDNSSNLLTKIIYDSNSFISSLPTGSHFSVDSSFDRRELFKEISETKKHKNPELIDFIKYYTKQEYLELKSQIVLIVGDVGKMLKTEKQDVIDMVRILNVKGVRVSVLSYGKSPDISFYNKIAQVGNGTYRITNKNLNIRKWMKTEMQKLHSIDYTNLNVTITAKNNVSITSILSPTNQRIVDDKITFTIDKFSEGRNFIMFAKVRYPKLKGIPKTKILNIKLNYFDNNENKYKFINADKFIEYVFNKNDVSSNINVRIERSSLILKTKKVIIDVVPMIKARRHYKAIALLTAQQYNLNKYLRLHDDKELARDSLVLSKYSDKLYQFDEKFIQFWQINQDLNWDNARFDYQYE